MTSSAEPPKPPTEVSHEKYLSNVEKVRVWSEKIRELADLEQREAALREEILTLEKDPLISNLRGQIRGASRVLAPSVSGLGKRKPSPPRTKRPSPADPTPTTVDAPSTLEKSPTAPSKKRKKDPVPTGTPSSPVPATTSTESLPPGPSDTRFS